MKRVLVYISACFLVLPALAKPSFEVFTLSGKRKEKISASPAFNWAWKKNAEKVRIVIQRVDFSNPAFSNFKKVRTKGKPTRGKLSGDKLSLQFNGLSETIALESGSRRMKLAIKGDYSDGPTVIDDNCTKFNLVLKPDQSSTPFYVGTSCVRGSKNIGITVSYPRGVSLEDSTLREIKGKGEQWKYYELGSIEQASETLTRFGFVYKKKKYNFDLVPLKAKTAEAPPRPVPDTIFYGGAGFGFSKIEGSDISASDATPLLILRVPHYPIVGSLGVSLLGEFNLPIGSSQTPIRYYQLGIFGSYEVKLGSFVIQPRVGYLISSEVDKVTGIGINSKHIGFGARFVLPLGTQFQVELEGLMASLGSANVNSHYAIELKLMRKKTSSVGWGFGARLQNFNATSNNLSFVRDFSQTEFFGLISF